MPVKAYAKEPNMDLDVVRIVIVLVLDWASVRNTHRFDPRLRDLNAIDCYKDFAPTELGVAPSANVKCDWLR